MRFCLLIFFSFLIQNTSGQILVNQSLLPFSKGSLQSANTSLQAIDNGYKVIYFPSLYLLKPAKTAINDNMSLSELLQFTRDSSISFVLDKVLREQQTVDLETANTYFNKLKDNENTILILDNIVETLASTAGTETLVHTQGRQFIYGSAIPNSLKTILSGYSPVKQLDFNTTGANDQYLNEYISFVTSTVTRKGAGSVTEDVYPQAFPVLLLRPNGADSEYIYLDSELTLTDDERKDLKSTIISEAKGYYIGVSNAEVTPIIKKEELASFDVLMVYAFKMKKEDQFGLARIDDAKREWFINNNKVSDQIIAPSGKLYSMEVFKDLLADGENILQVTSTIGDSTFKNKRTFSISMKFNYNSNNLFVRAIINGKTSINYPLISPVVIAADEQGTALKEKDKVVISIYQKVDGVEKKKEDALWGTDNDDLKTAKEYMRIIQSGNSEIVFKTDNKGKLIIIRFASQQSGPPVETYKFDIINTIALKSQKDKDNADAMYKKALDVIRNGNEFFKSDVDLANYFRDNNGLIQTYALPSSDKSLKIAKGKVLNGVANCNPDITTSHYKWLDIKVNQDKGVLEDKNVRLIAYINAVERQTLLNANTADTGGIKAGKENILERIGKGRPDLQKTLATLIENQKLTDQVLDTCYEYVQDDPMILTYYINMSKTKKTISLNYGSISNTQEFFTAITAHEMMHIYFPVHNVLSTLKWMVIRDKEKAYKLDLGTGECSEGPSHEKNNPECEAVCGKQKQFTP